MWLFPLDLATYYYPSYRTLLPLPPPPLPIFQPTALQPPKNPPPPLPAKKKKEEKKGRSKPSEAEILFSVVIVIGNLGNCRAREVAYFFYTRVLERGGEGGFGLRERERVDGIGWDGMGAMDVNVIRELTDSWPPYFFWGGGNCVGMGGGRLFRFGLAARNIRPNPRGREPTVALAFIQHHHPYTNPPHLRHALSHALPALVVRS